MSEANNRFWITAGICNSLRFPSIRNINNNVSKSTISTMGGDVGVIFNAQKEYISFPSQRCKKNQSMLITLKKTYGAINQFHRAMDSLLVVNHNKNNVRKNHNYEELLCNLIKLYIIPGVSTKLIRMNKKNDIKHKMGICIRLYDILHKFGVKEHNKISFIIPDNVILLICDYILFN